MITFNEKHHAFIVSMYYRELKKGFGERGIKAFIKAAQIYGEQRGRRMSLRALRDGKELTYPAYFAYSEWKPTPELSEIVKEVKGNTVHINCYKCPWNAVFEENQLLEAGEVYCKEIDKAIVRGFNPGLKFELRSFLHDDDCCRMCFIGVKDVDKAINNIEKKNRETYIMSFHYHCGHVFKAFQRTSIDIFGNEALDVIDRVKEAVNRKYGEEFLEGILEYEDEDFNFLPKNEDGF